MAITINKRYFLLPLLLTAQMGFEASAQTCGGELVKFQETFGRGSAKDSLPTGRTNYHYNSATALSDGDYIIYHTSGGKPEWWDAGDHTGDSLGRMMVTNASFAAGEFYRDTVYGLSSLENYEVYFYVMNVDKPALCSSHPIQTKLQLIVESYNTDGTFTEISSFYSDSIQTAATPTWVRVAGQVYLPTGVTAIRYRIINNSTGGCGNDLAIDDITFSQCDLSVLAMHSIELRAVSQTNGVDLQWNTPYDHTIRRFEIQKSNDNRTWYKLAATEPQIAIDHYRFYDMHAASHLSYYRIVSTNDAQQVVYSNTVVVRNGMVGGSGTLAAPNPFQDNLQLNITSPTSTMSRICLFDLNGRMAHQLSRMLNEGDNRINLSGLNTLRPGMYLVAVSDSQGNRFSSSKVIKR